MKRFLLSLSAQNITSVSKLSLLLSAAIVTSGVGLLAHPAGANPLGGPLGVCTLREKLVKAGDWRTLESYWNATGHAFFQGPVGAEIKVRYGYSFLGKDRQKQKLDGQNFKKLEVGAFSVAYARMQMKVRSDTTVRYFACSGGVANDLPKVPF